MVEQRVLYLYPTSDSMYRSDNRTHIYTLLESSDVVVGYIVRR